MHLFSFRCYTDVALATYRYLTLKSRIGKVNLAEDSCQTLDPNGLTYLLVNTYVLTNLDKQL